MRHRLGRFEPKPGSSVYDSFHLHPKLAPLVTRALEEMLRVPLSPHAPHQVAALPPEAPGVLHPRAMKLPPGPDLLSVIRPGHPDRVWVTEVKDELEELSRRFEIRLLACEYEPGPDGFIAIAGTSPSISAEVREHDPVMAGFVALRDRELPLKVVSRIFRVVCENGSLVSTHEQEIEATGFTVEERVQRCFERERFVRGVEALRRAAEHEVADPEGMLDEMWHMTRRGPESVEQIAAAYQELVMGQWRAAADPTVYGLLNAVTATARDLTDFRERLDLEELGGSLASLDSGPWSRNPDPEHATALV